MFIMKNSLYKFIYFTNFSFHPQNFIYIKTINIFGNLKSVMQKKKNCVIQIFKNITYVKIKCKLKNIKPNSRFIVNLIRTKFQIDPTAIYVERFMKLVTKSIRNCAMLSFPLSFTFSYTEFPNSKAAGLAFTAAGSINVEEHTNHQVQRKQREITLLSHSVNVQY